MRARTDRWVAIAALLLCATAERVSAQDYVREATPNAFRDLTTAETALELPLAGKDEDGIGLELGFSFPFFGQSFTTVTVATNGYLTFGTAINPLNEPIPSNFPPDGLIAPFWDDLDLRASGKVLFQREQTQTGQAALVIQWEDVAFAGDLASRLSFQVVLIETGEIQFHYGELKNGDGSSGGRASGSSATVGLEAPNGAYGAPVSFDTPGVLSSFGRGIAFLPSGPALPEGRLLGDLDGDGRVTILDQSRLVELAHPDYRVPSALELVASDVAPLATNQLVSVWGNGRIDVSDRDLVSDRILRRVALPPYLGALSPVRPTPGQTLTLTGSDFAPTAADNRVVFPRAGGGTVTVSAATVNAPANSRLTVSVPADARSGPVYVVRQGQRSNARALIPAGIPSITAVAPLPAVVGEEITIVGEEFPATAAETIVRIGSATATVVSLVQGTDGNPDQLVARISSDLLAGVQPLRVATASVESEPVDLALGDLPIARIDAPLTGAEVRDRITVYGAATDPSDFARYELAIAPLEGGDFTVIHSATAAVTSGALGVLDPTTLINGYYRLRLTVTDAQGLSASDETSFSAEGVLKLGVFSLEYLDLEIPVSGIAVRVIREYDSREKRSLDFGYGWRLRLVTLDLQEEADHGVIVQNPASWRVEFDFTPEQVNPIDPRFHRAGFTSTEEKGGGELDFETPDGVLEGNHILSRDGVGNYFWFPSMIPFDPKVYVMTQLDGTRLRIDDERGLLQAIKPDGNSITVTRDGLVHSSGVGVSFERDAFDRIVRIVDPLQGSLNYEYDGSGDLLLHTDPDGVQSTYDYHPGHYLRNWTEPGRSKPVRNEYDSSGRLVATVDPFGERIEIEHDVAQNLEIVRDKLGRPTITEYDARGRVVRTLAADGTEQRMSYDENDNLLSRTDEAGGIWSFEYDSRGFQTASTTPLGARTERTFDDRGNTLTVRDPEGGLVARTWSSENKLLTETDALLRTTVRTYDSAGNAASITFADGRTVTYEHDEKGRISKMVDSSGRTTLYETDDNGRITKETVIQPQANGPALRAATIYTYSPAGRLLATQRADGTSLVRTYDETGRISSVEVDAVSRTNFAYDDLGRHTQTIDQDGTVQVRDYDSNGHLLAITDEAGTRSCTLDPKGRITAVTLPSGDQIAVSYDAVGRVVSRTDARGKVWGFVYDAAGRKVKDIDPLGNGTVYEYDQNDRVTAIRDADGRVTQFEYDLAGFLAARVLPDGRRLLIERDEVGRPIRRQDRHGREIELEYGLQGAVNKPTQVGLPVGSLRYSYDLRGRVTERVDALENRTRYVYDPSTGQRSAIELPLGQIQRTEYDDLGHPSATVDFAGQRTEHYYDEEGRLVQERYPDGSGVRIERNRLGAETKIEDATGTIRQAFDLAGRLSLRLNGDGSSLEYRYDQNGNVSQLIASVGTFTYTYDDASRLASISDPWGRQATLGYTPAGALERIERPNGVVTTVAYDQLGGITRLAHVGSQSNTIAGYTYQYDSNGLRTRSTEDSGRVVDYAYDSSGRLVLEKSTVASLSSSLGYTYYANGDRQTRTMTRSDGTIESTTYTYDANSRLLREEISDTAPGTSPYSVEYSYDDNGSLLSRIAPLDSASFTYDARRRLVEVARDHGGTRTVVSYVYDHFGNRVETIRNGVATRHVVDSNRPLARTLLDLDESGNVLQVYTAAQLPLWSRDALGAERHWLQDGTLSTRTITDSTGSVVTSISYDAFGQILAGAAAASDVTYAADRLDQDTGLLFLRSRYLHVASGRFITRDTFEGFALEPIGQNPYVYADQNPVTKIDPPGTMAFSIGFAVGVAIPAMLQALDVRIHEIKDVVQFGKNAFNAAVRSWKFIPDAIDYDLLSNMAGVLRAMPATSLLGEGLQFLEGALTRSPSDPSSGQGNPTAASEDVKFVGQPGPELVLPSAITGSYAASGALRSSSSPAERLQADRENYGVPEAPLGVSEEADLLGNLVRWIKQRPTTYTDVLLLERQRDAAGEQVGNNFVDLQFTVAATGTRWCLNIVGDDQVSTLERVIANDPRALACDLHRTSTVQDFVTALITGCRPPNASDQFHPAPGVRALRRERLPTRSLPSEPVQGHKIVGEGVMANSGEFVLSRTDLDVGGRGMTFRVTRTYRSGLIYPNEYDFHLGHNWTLSCDERLSRVTRTPDMVELDGQGRVGNTHSYSTRFRGTIPAPPPGVFASQVVEPVSYELEDGTTEVESGYMRRTATGNISFFNGRGWLIERRDRNGNRLRFIRDRFDLLKRVIDTQGREYVFEYESRKVQNVEHNLIVAITDVTGGRTCRYEYDDNLDLVAATSFEGRREEYVYSGGGLDFALRHNMLQVRRPNEVASGQGPYVVNIYDTVPNSPNKDRVVQQLLGGSVQIPDLNARNGEQMLVQAGGIFEFSYASAAVVNTRSRLDTLNSAFSITTVKDRRGGTTVFTFSAFGNPITHRDEAGHQIRYAYDEDGLQRSVTYPNGQSEFFGYDKKATFSFNRGNMVYHLRLPGGDSDEPGVLTGFEYEPLFNQVTRITETQGFQQVFGPPSLEEDAVEWLESQRSSDFERFSTLTFYDYQEGSGPLDPSEAKFGIDQTLVEELVERGLGDLNLDGRVSRVRGNPVAFRKHLVTQPELQEIWTRISYNDWGLPERIIDAEGSTRAVTYHPSGYTHETVEDPDGFALKTVGLYNDLGLLEESVDARGNRTVYEYDKDGLVKQIHKAANDSSVGFRIRYEHDENKNVVKVLFEDKGAQDSVPGRYFEVRQTYDILNQAVQRGQLLGDRYLVTHNEYDRGQVPTRITLPEGNSITFEHDERKLLVARTRGAGTSDASTERWTYDEVRNVLSHSDGRTLERTFVYGGHSWLKRVRTPAGYETRLTHDAVGNPIQVERYDDFEKLLGRTDTTLDELYRPIEQTQWITYNPPRVAKTKTEYDRVGLVTKVTEPDGQSTTMVYDAVGRLLAATDPLGNQVRMTYDANSNPILTERQETSNGANETYRMRTVYDALDRPIRTTDDLGRTFVTQYDSRSLVVATFDARGPLGPDTLPPDDPRHFAGQINTSGNVTRFYYDTTGRRVRMEKDLVQGGVVSPAALPDALPSNPDARVAVRWEYDRNSNLVKALDDQSNATQFDYDALDRPIQKTCADGTVWQTAYDAADNPIEVRDPNGSRVVSRYDNENRLVQVTTPLVNAEVIPVSQTFAYDGLNRLVRATESAPDFPVHVVSRTYDLMSRLLTETQNGKSVQYTYDDDSRLTSCVYPQAGAAGGRKLFYDYDELDRLTAIRADSPTGVALATYAYRGVDRRVRRENGNGTSARMELGDGSPGYDQLKRPIGLLHRRSGEAPFVERSYEYDRASNRTVVRRGDEGLEDQYAYDSLSRIAKARFDQAGEAGTQPLVVRGLREKSYEIDGTNNRRSVEHVDSVGAVSSTAYATNAVHEYTSVGMATLRYDRNGNLVGDGNVTGNKERTFRYDSLNRLRSITRDGGGAPVLFAYDALGRRTARIQSSASVEFFHDGLRCIRETGSSSGDRREYVYGTGLTDVVLSETIRGTQKEKYFHHSGMWDSTLALTNEAGEVVDRALYDDYGRPFFQDQTAHDNAGNPVLFQGQRYDPGTQLYYYRARFYDPLLGRFLQRDPLGTWADPMGLGNPYVGLRNNPINVIDPDGKLPPLIIAGAVLGGAINVAINYTMNRVMGKDYTWKDAAVDFGVGAATAAFGGWLANLAKVAGRGSSALFAVRTAFGEAGIGTVGEYIRWHAHGRKGKFDPVATMAQELAFGAAFGAAFKVAGAGVSRLASGFRGAGKATGRTLGKLVGRVADNPCRIRGTAAGKRLKRVLDWMEIKCFVAGTLVETKEGKKPIEEIAVGDYVLARDEHTGQQGWKPVTQLWRAETERVCHLTVLPQRRGRGERRRQRSNNDGKDGGEESSDPLIGPLRAEEAQYTIRCTPGHSFYRQDPGEWVSADRLVAGDTLVGADGNPISVAQVAVVQASARTFNLTVAEWHTYFVAGGAHGTGALSHNNNGPCDPTGAAGSRPLGLPYHGPQSQTLSRVRRMRQPDKWQAGEELVRETLEGAPTHFPTPTTGGRHVDSFGSPGITQIAAEVKTYHMHMGAETFREVPLTDELRRQIFTDVWLRREMGVRGYDPRWIFLDAGPSKPLEDMLKTANITWTQHLR